MQAADIDWQLPALCTGYQLIAAGAWAAAAGSVILRAEVRGSTQTCLHYQVTVSHEFINRICEFCIQYCDNVGLASGRAPVCKNFWVIRCWCGDLSVSVARCNWFEIIIDSPAEWRERTWYNRKLLPLHPFDGLFFQHNPCKRVPERQNQSGLNWGKRW